jgi:CubicO group peptidase (beta-lactamase class C family)
MAVLEPRTDVEVDGRVLPLHGSYDERFARVVEAFIENYRVEEEVGSAVSVVVDGETVVDLWGGCSTSSVSGSGTATPSSA